MTNNGMKFQLSEVFGPEKFLTLPFSPQRSTFWVRRRFICTGSNNNNTPVQQPGKPCFSASMDVSPFLGDQFVVNKNDYMSYHLTLGLKLFIYFLIIKAILSNILCRQTPHVVFIILVQIFKQWIRIQVDISTRSPTMLCPYLRHVPWNSWNYTIPVTQSPSGLHGTLHL